MRRVSYKRSFFMRILSIRRYTLRDWSRVDFSEKQIQIRLQIQPVSRSSSLPTSACTISAQTAWLCKCDRGLKLHNNFLCILERTTAYFYCRQRDRHATKYVTWCSRFRPIIPLDFFDLVYSYIPVNLKIIPFSMKKLTDVKNSFLWVQIITVHKAMPVNLPDYRAEHIQLCIYKAEHSIKTSSGTLCWSWWWSFTVQIRVINDPLCSPGDSATEYALMCMFLSLRNLLLTASQ